MKNNYRGILSIGFLSVMVVALVFMLTGCGFLGQNPIAKIETDPSPGDNGAVGVNVGDVVEFDGSSSEASTSDGEITDYNWTFPDEFDRGSPEGNAVQTGSFTAADSYSVSLEVVGDEGKDDETSVDVEVSS